MQCYIHHVVKDWYLRKAAHTSMHGMLAWSHSVPSGLKLEFQDYTWTSAEPYIFRKKHFRPFLSFIQFLKSMKWDRVHTLFGLIIQGDLKEFRDTIPIFKDCFHHYHVTPDSSFQFSQNLDTATMNLNFLQGPSILFTDFQGLKV